nr:PaaI family thioesterase [Maritimibacter sp. DP1N21-5]
MLGVELVSIARGRSELRMPITNSHKQHMGFTHGGAVASLADMALAYAGGPMMGGGAVTQEFKINFLRPGIGETLIARGEVIGAGKMQAVVRADVLVLAEGAEKLCATAQGTIMKAAP